MQQKQFKIKSKFGVRNSAHALPEFGATVLVTGFEIRCQHSVHIRCAELGTQKSVREIRRTKFGAQSSVREIRCTKFGAQNSVREIQKLSLRGQTLSKGCKQQLQKAVTIPGGAGDRVSDGNHAHVNASIEK